MGSPRNTEKTFIIVVFAKNAYLLASDATIYTKTPKDRYQRNQWKGGKTLVFAILTKNASFRSYDTFAYLLCAHIRNINIYVYVHN